MAINYYNGQIKKAVVVANQGYHTSFSSRKNPLSQPKISLRAQFLFNLKVLVFYSLSVPNSFAYFS
jgi:hypothetical protein